MLSLLLVWMVFCTCSKGGDDTKEPALVEVTGIQLSQNSLSLKIGEKALLTATVSPSNATDKTVRWSSSQKSVATVSNAGQVTAIGNGTAVITATAGNKSAKCAVTVQDGVIVVESVSLSEESLTLGEGETAILVVTILPGDATDKAITWTSSDEAVATVSNGVVTAVKEGTATITATAGGKSAQCIVTVKKDVVAVTGITLSQTTLSLEEGKSVTLTATVQPSNATNKTVSWSSSNAAVATVSDGVVTAVKEGTATITATAGDKSAQCTVTVKRGVVAVTSITLSQTTLTLKEGENATLIPTVYPDNATDKTVIWDSSDVTVATVSLTGVVTAVKEGIATITATAGDKSAQCTVTVKKDVVAVTGITLSQTTLSLEEGKSATLIATVQPSNATDKTVSWSSSNTSVATVSNGVVTAVKEGTATITATAGGKSAQCTVTVKKGVVAVTGITLSQTSLSLEECKSATLTATVQPSNATDKTVSWSSSNTSVATISNGVVTAVKEGTATITASAGGKTAQCTVTVTKAFVAVTGITLSQTSLSLEKGKTITLTATVAPADATDKTVSWSSSDASVATVSSSGVVTAVKAGKATITAAAGGKSAQCVVSVKEEGGMDAGINPWEEDDEDFGGTVN